MGFKSQSSDMSSDGGSSIGSSYRSNIEDTEDDLGMTGRRRGIEFAIFNTMHQLHKHQFFHSTLFCTIRIIFDFLQTFLIIFGPQYDWGVDFDTGFWNRVSHFQLGRLAIEQGHTPFSIVFFVTSFAVVCVATFWMYIGWRLQNNVNQKDYILKLMSIFSVFTLHIFYPSILHLFLTNIDCVTLDGSYVKEDFRDTTCFTMPHILQNVWACISSLTLVIFGTLYTIATSEVNYSSTTLLSTPNPSYLVKTTWSKSILFVAEAAFTQNMKLNSVVNLIVSTWMLIWLIRYSPYYVPLANVLKVFLYAILCWASVSHVVLAWGGNGSMTLYAGAVPFAIGAMLLAKGRKSWLRSFVAERIQQYAEGARLSIHFRPLDVKRKITPMDIEILSRVAQIRDEDFMFIPDNINLADAILVAGLSYFERTVYIEIVYASFVHAVTENDNVSTAISHLDKAKKLLPNFLERYLIYVMDKKLQAENNNENRGDTSTMDLESYLEFQRSYKLLLNTHRAVFKASQRFWRHLLSRIVNFSHLSRAFLSLDNQEQRAVKVYQSVLERYPKSIKVLRSYARFLEEIKNDPWTANKYYQDAERIEDNQAEMQRNLISNNDDADTNIQVDDTKDAVCVISTSGIIQMTNRLCNKMFGYKKDEILGKNVNVMMPQPFSSLHQGFINDYMSGGQAKVIGKWVSQVALHKERYTFACQIFVTKITQGGVDRFMGVFRVHDEDFTQVILHCTTNGMIVSANSSVYNFFGYKAVECMGQQLHTMFGHDELFQTCLSQQEGEDVLHEETPLKHKHGFIVMADIHAQITGTSTQKLIVIKFVMKKSELNVGIIVLDKLKYIRFCNREVTNILGIREFAVIGSSITQLIPKKIAPFHTKWIGDGEGHYEWGCMQGRVVSMLGAKGIETDVRFQTIHHKSDEHAFKVYRQSTEDRSLSVKCILHVTTQGIINSVEGDMKSLTGFDEELEGCMINELIDVADNRINSFSATPTPQRLASILKFMVSQNRRSAVLSWRSVLRNPTTSDVIPCLLYCEANHADDSDYLVHVLRFDRLEAFMQVTRDFNVEDVEGDCAMIFGRQSLKNEHLQSLFKLVQLGNNMDDFMGPSSKNDTGYGAMKTKDSELVSSPMEVPFVFPDSTVIRLRVECLKRVIRSSGHSKGHRSQYVIRVTGDGEVMNEDEVFEVSSKIVDTNDIEERSVRDEHVKFEDTRSWIESNQVISHEKNHSNDSASSDSSFSEDSNYAEEKGSQSGSDITDVSRGTSVTSDYTAARRYQRLEKILRQANIHNFIDQLRKHMKWIIASFLVVHVCSFIVLRIQSSKMVSLRNALNFAGEANVLCIRICTLSRVYATDGDESVRNLISGLIAEFENIQKTLMLGEGGINAAEGDARDVFQLATLSTSTLVDVEGTLTIVPQLNGLWDVGNRLISNVRMMLTLPVEDIATSPEFMFVILNVPWVISNGFRELLDIEITNASSGISSILNQVVLILVLEAAIFIPIMCGYIFVLIKRCAEGRSNLFSMFLLVPKPALTALAKKEIILDEEEEDEDDITQEEQHEEHPKKKKHKRKKEVDLSTSLNFNTAARKANKSNMRDIVKLIFPHCMWAILVSIFAIFGYILLATQTQAVVQIGVAYSRLYESQRAHFFLHEIGNFNDTGSLFNYSLPDLRRELWKSADTMNMYHQGLLYGATDTGIDERYRISFAQDIVVNNLQGSVLDNTHRALYFPDEKTCLRSIVPCDEQFESITQHGLGNLVREYVTQCVIYSNLITNVTMNTMYSFLWHVGDLDLLDGLQKSIQLYNEDAERGPQNEVIMQSMLFAIFVLGGIGFYYGLFSPYLQRAMIESKRVASMMAQLPGSMGLDLINKQSALLGLNIEESDETPNENERRNTIKNCLSVLGLGSTTSVMTTKKVTPFPKNTPIP